MTGCGSLRAPVLTGFCEPRPAAPAGRQGQDVVPREFLQQAVGLLDSIPAGGRLPAQVHADGVTSSVRLSWGNVPTVS